MSAPSRRILDAVVLLGPRSGERLLEIGCGTGQAIEAVLAMQPTVRIAAIDRSATAVARAGIVNEAAIRDGGASIALGDIDETVPGGGPFDRVFAIRVNSFWTKPGHALPNVLACLKPGGELWAIYDGPAAKTDGQILDSMRAAGMRDVRTVGGQGASALVGRKR